MYDFSFVDHTSERIGKTDLAVLTRSDRVSFEIREDFWGDDVFSYHTETRRCLLGLRFLEKFRNSIESSLLR